MAQRDTAIGNHAESLRTLEEKQIGLSNENKMLRIQNMNLTRIVETSIPKSEHDERTRLLQLELDGLNASLDMEQQKSATALVDNDRLRSNLNDARLALEVSQANERFASNRVELVDQEILQKTRKIESLEQEARHIRRSHRDELRALEASHALTVSILEQAHATAIAQLESQISLLAVSAEKSQERLKILTIENTDLKSLTAYCPSSESRGAQCEALLRAEGVETDSISTNVKGINTEHSQSLIATRKCTTCHACSSRAVGILFPCGHGVCESCFTKLCDLDKEMRGFACLTCDDGLPVTRICRANVIADIFSANDILV